MSEKSLVNYTLKGMRKLWRKPVKHADAFTSGIADLSAYIRPVGNIWIECKALDKWPKRPYTVVKFEMDDLQRDFLLERRGWLWCRVGREYLLFHYSDAYWIVDTEQATQERLRRVATKIWVNKVDWQEFAAIISRRTGDETGDGRINQDDLSSDTRGTNSIPVDERKARKKAIHKSGGRKRRAAA